MGDSGQLEQKECDLGGDDDERRPHQQPLANQGRSDGNDPCGKVDDHRQGVDDDERLRAVPGHDPEQGEQGQNGDGDPAEHDQCLRECRPESRWRPGGGAGGDARIIFVVDQRQEVLDSTGPSGISGVAVTIPERARTGAELDVQPFS
jgi:hypothetical protein